MKDFILRKEKLIWLGFCFLAVFIIYGRTLLGGFVYDDRAIIEHQTMLSNLNKFDQVIMSPHWSEEAGLYRPTVLASYALNYIILGSEPWGFHLINLLFYAASIFLIALVLKRLFKDKPLAYLTAALFLVLPIHTEAVANIVGRAEILALFFSLLVFWELLKKDIVWWRVGLWLALALGSKETAVAAVPVAMLIIYLKEKEFFSRSVLQKYAKTFLALILGSSVYFGLRFLVLGKVYFLKAATSLVENPLQFVSAKERIFTALSVLTMYLEKSFWPFNLCSDYSYNQLPIIKIFLSPATLIGALVIVFLASAVFIFLKRAPALALASAIFIFSYLPIANLIFPTGTIAGERLMFYPSLGLCLFLSWLILAIYEIIAEQPSPPKLLNFNKFLLKFYLLISLCRHKNFIKNFFAIMKIYVHHWFRSLFIRRWALKQVLVYLYLAVLLTTFIFYGYMSFRRAGDWLTEKRLFISAAKCAPNSVLSQSNLGATYYLDKDLINAKKALLISEQIYDGYPKGINNLGLVYWKEGNRELARKYFLHALDFEFPYYGAYENLALMAIEDKNWAEARSWLMELYSGSAEAADNYIRLYRGN